MKSRFVKTFRMAVAIASAISFVSCSPKVEDPALSALKSKIGGIVGEGARVTMYSFELIDSTTVGEELDYRLEVMGARLSQNEKLYNQYRKEGKGNNAALKLDAMHRTEKVIKGLEELKVSLGEGLGNIAYYDYKFSGKASSKTSVLDFPEGYASISPDCEVLSMETDRRALHKTLGRTVPGYLEIVKGEEE